MIYPLICRPPAETPSLGCACVSSLAPWARRIAVVACMDVRINVYGILGLAEGDAHVIRNAGGVVTDDEIRSLAISQRLLGTREIILIHHTDCGMLTSPTMPSRPTCRPRPASSPPGPPRPSPAPASS